MTELGQPTTPCPSKRCGGMLRMQATGVDGQGRPVEYHVCGQCGRTVEKVGPAIPSDHPTLFGGGT